MTPIEPSQRILRNARCLAAVTVLLSGCVASGKMGDNVTYDPPSEAPSVPTMLKLKGDAPAVVLRSVAADLKQAGFQITRQNAASGTLTAVSASRDLADCGILTQTARGTSARIAGTAPLAAIFDDQAPNGVLRREMSVRTEVTVVVSPTEDGTVTVSLEPELAVTLRKLSADGKTVLTGETQKGPAGSTLVFADGMRCTSSARLSEVLR